MSTSSAVDRRLRSISHASVCLDFSKFTWGFDDQDGNLVKHYATQLPREVWMVGEGPGAQYVVVTYLLPDGEDIPEPVTRALSCFPSLPPDEVLWELEAMRP